MFLHESNYAIWCYGNTVADAAVLGSIPSWMSYDCKGTSNKKIIQHVQCFTTHAES